MQIRALDAHRRVVFAGEAVKHQDYHCFECNEPVRLRSGMQRQAHFYHIRPNGACRLHSKGLPHLMLQYHLLDLLPEGEAEIECRFDTIGRIADVAWHPRRLIYEIQCSPIRPQEIIERNRDYASIGYQVIWILHENRYNKYRLSAAENALSGHPHYYSNMDAGGEGKIYDQLSIVHKGRRTARLAPVAINPAIPLDYPRQIRRLTGLRTLPPPLVQRLRTWKSAVAGDAAHRLMGYLEDKRTVDMDYPGLEEQFEHLINTYDRTACQKIAGCVRLAWTKCLATPYRSLLQLILEKACR